MTPSAAEAVQRFCTAVEQGQYTHRLLPDLTGEVLARFNQEHAVPPRLRAEFYESAMQAYKAVGDPVRHNEFARRRDHVPLP